jgi:prolyl 4-hydroxylase
MTDPNYRLVIGAAVRDRLLETPNTFKVPADGLDLFVCRNFLPSAHCAALIARIDEGRRPSTVLAERPDPEFRTSETCNLDAMDPLTRQVETRITRLMGIDPSHGETIQGQRYSVGQQFKCHHDFFYTSEAYWAEQERSGGQRTWTVMVFLNEPEAGGQTEFPHAKVKIAPKRGNLLAWNNLDPLGEPNEQSLHQGLPVAAGLKYIITKWYRERPWR